jgi:hypothetical protein
LSEEKILSHKLESLVVQAAGSCHWSLADQGSRGRERGKKGPERRVRRLVVV